MQFFFTFMPQISAGFFLEVQLCCRARKSYKKPHVNRIIRIIVFAEIKISFQDH